MERLSPRWLRLTPRLLAGYWQWTQWRHLPGWRRGLVGGGLLAAWACLGLGLVWAAGPAAAWLRERLQAHEAMLAAASLAASALAVARRRTLRLERASRSWLAAVPVLPTAARVEAFVIDTAPLALVLAGGAVAVGLVWLADRWLGHGWPVAIGRLGAWSGSGIAVGACLGRWLPTARPVELPPSSRYVPRPRRGGAVMATPSLAALGIWPIRQMFASARPKAVAHALVPVLLLMPLGTQADAALVVVGLFVVTGGLVLLLSAFWSVGAFAARWLRPLPLEFARLARAIWLPSLGAAAAAWALDAWLLWVMGKSAGDAIFVAGWAFCAWSVAALGGGALAIRGSGKSQ